MASKSNSPTITTAAFPHSPPRPHHPALPTTFPQFPKLPTELRLEIWNLAVPRPGLNFFNVHSIPNAKPGTSRSSQPNQLYLDMRRLDIAHDDEAVSLYDPSCWQARAVLMRVCREARTAVALRSEDTFELRLAVPKRGLFLHRDDGELRRMTPLYVDAAAAAACEALVHRHVRLHKDEMAVLMFENCAFNICFEERLGHQNLNLNLNLNLARASTHGNGGRAADADDVDDVDDDEELHSGWSFDPEFRYECVNLALRQLMWCVGKTRPCAEPDRQYPFGGCDARGLLAYGWVHDGEFDCRFPPEGLLVMEQQLYEPKAEAEAGPAPDVDVDVDAPPNPSASASSPTSASPGRQHGYALDGDDLRVEADADDEDGCTRLPKAFYDRSGDVYSLGHKKHGTCGWHHIILSRISPMDELWKQYIESATIRSPQRRRVR